MELSTFKDAFERITKKQKLSSSRNREVIDQVSYEIEGALLKLQADNVDSGSFNQKSVLRDLRSKLYEMAPLNQLEGSQKELNVGFSKYAKLLENNFNPDICKACGNVNFDVHILNQVIANHFYRQGLFDLGDCFVQEAHEPGAGDLKLPFLDMYNILEAMRCRDIGPALAWATAQSERLLMNGSSLQLKLHQLQYMEILQKGGIDEALEYARKYLAPLASVHKVGIQKLMACLLWAGHLGQSPYAEFCSAARWEDVVEEVPRQFCSLLGQSNESPLSMVVAAGVVGLPTLLKLSSVIAANKKQDWKAVKQLLVPVDLGREFQFHSIFVCPILREQGSQENPPMLLPCGHVLSKQSILKLSKSTTQPFKCPFCPLEATISQCNRLHF